MVQTDALHPCGNGSRRRTQRAERIRRVAQGFDAAEGERIAGLGGGFRYCELEERCSTRTARYAMASRSGELAARFCFLRRWASRCLATRDEARLFLGACRDVGVYLLLQRSSLGDLWRQWRQCAHARAAGEGFHLSTVRRSFTVQAVCLDATGCRRNVSSCVEHHTRSSELSRVPAKKSSLPSEPLEPLIFSIRGRRVMLDADLARLYGVTTKRFNEAFKRNRQRFA